MACVPRRPPGRALLGASLLVFLALLAGTAATARAELPPQGVYEQCGPNDAETDCLGRLDLAGATGFELVLNYMSWFGSAQEVLAYADRAHLAGVRLIWPLNDPAWRGERDLPQTYRYLRGDCSCSDPEAFFAYAIDLVKDHPATWGFYLGDELPADAAPRVAELARRVRLRAPDLPTLYVSLENDGTMGSNLRPFAGLMDIAGSNYYPIGWGASLASTGPIAAAVQDVADRAGGGSAFVLQAFSWAQYDDRAPEGHLFPSREQMLQMRNLVLDRASPRILLWYGLHDVLRSDDPSRRLSDLRAAAFADLGPRAPKLDLSRVTVRADGTLDIIGRISARASGEVRVRLRAQGRTMTTRVPIDPDRRRISARERLSARMRSAIKRAGRAGGIVDITYPGDPDTRPKRIRTRIAARPARLRLSHLALRGTRLRARGTVARAARGVVRVRVSYLDARGRPGTRTLRGRISGGRWRASGRLPITARDVYATVQFTGYAPRGIRGEMTARAPVRTG